MSDGQHPDNPDFKCARTSEYSQFVVASSDIMRSVPPMVLPLGRPWHVCAPDRQFVDAATVSVCEPFVEKVTVCDPANRGIERDVTVTAIGKFYKKGELRFERHYEQIRDAIARWVPKELEIASIKISTKPRYKQSSFSGNEWRISAVAEFFNSADEKVHEIGDHSLEDLRSKSAINETWDILPDLIDNKCDQEGCSKEATITLKLKKEVCTSCGNKQDYNWQINYRQFCDEHRCRGDCGIDDCNDNYVQVENELVDMNRQPPVLRPPVDESEFSDSSDW